MQNYRKISSNNPSLDEWNSLIGDVKTMEAMRKEDKTKTERIEFLAKHTDTKYRFPRRLEATDFEPGTPTFEELKKIFGEAPLRFRVLSKSDDNKKFRNIGLSIDEMYSWYKKLDIDPRDYRLEIFRHELSTNWAFTFIVNKDGIFGDAVRGPHLELAEGDTESQLFTFFFDYAAWKVKPDDPELVEELKRVVEQIHMNDEQQEKMTQGWESTFANNYLEGYFEVIDVDDGDIYYIDYNRLIPRYVTTPKLEAAEAGKGLPASSGVAEGKAVFVTDSTINSVDFKEGNILVCDFTNAQYIPLMMKASAVVTARGTILSHPSIVAREMQKPCVVSFKNAQKLDQKMLRVDGSSGKVEIIEK